MAEAISKNFSCVLSGEFYHTSTENTKIDATMCKETGDIFLRLNSPKLGCSICVVFLDDHLPQKPSVNKTAASSFLMSPANASPSDESKETTLFKKHEKTAQVYTFKICQRILPDNRTLLRKIRRGSQYYDEFWDTFTGGFINSYPVGCNSPC
ncbi:MAG: hypothetical protein QNK92_05380 [Amylibacter sp.]